MKRAPSQRALSHRGAALTEYVLALALLIVVLVPVGIALTMAATTRTNESLSTVNKVSPCSNRLAQLADARGGDRSIDNDSNRALIADICN